ncbi:MAG TPA: serine hydrolase domain-containing protein, partial [Ilumatobacteraceae bacterium]|nr:serine hydrolase domain-containing protein [Ilumatobacteraceae bacterium]
MSVPLSGHCDAAFSAVRDAFAGNFVERGEVGGAVTVIVDGRVVVDLAGGWADAEELRPWQADTLVNFYSVGKAFIALLVLQLIDAGLIGLDDPIAAVWPEFGVGGKQGATVRHALCHRAGVPAIREPLTNDDLWNWERMTTALAATEAWWEPGTRHAYHTNTYGHLLGEIVRRTTGDMPGARLRALADPLDADLYWGVPDDEQRRCADVIWAPANEMPDVDFAGLSGESLMVALGYFNPPGYSSRGVVNTAQWRRAQVPSTNGHGSATGVARFYAALLEPGRLLSPELLAEATRSQSEGYCPVLGEETTFGLGFKPTSRRRPFGPNPQSFG